MAQGVRDALSAWQDFREEAEGYRELDDERVLVLIDWRGRGKTSGLQLEQMRAKGADLVHVRDGKVTRLVTYLDRERALTDLGLKEWAVSQANVNAARSSIDAWNRGGANAFVEWFHPEGELVSEIVGQMEGSDNVYRGRAAIHRFWDEWHSVWDLTIEVCELRDLGDTVLTLGRNQVRGRASGIDLDVPMAYVGEFESGLIRKLRAYGDPNQALKAVGLTE
jgi:ketosteroid isomerase-like protein